MNPKDIAMIYSTACNGFEVAAPNQVLMLKSAKVPTMQDSTGNIEVRMKMKKAPMFCNKQE